MKKITIYTDGACSGNPGPGGWGAVLIYNDVTAEISGFEPKTTNNRMELTAVIKALSALKQPCSIELHTDSAYVCNAFTNGWIEKWKNNGWITSSRKPVENQDLWAQLVSLSETHRIRWIKVKGHTGDMYNEICDKLATDAIRRQCGA